MPFRQVERARIPARAVVARPAGVVRGAVASTGRHPETEAALFICPGLESGTPVAHALNPRGVGTLNAGRNFVMQTTYTGTSGQQTRSASSVINTTWFIGDQGGFYSNGSSTASPSGSP